MRPLNNIPEFDSSDLPDLLMTYNSSNHNSIKTSENNVVVSFIVPI